MSVIAIASVKLVNLRRKIETALKQKDWASVERLNPMLMSALDDASSSDYRDLPSLVTEVEQVVALYRQLIAACEAEADYLLASV